MIIGFTGTQDGMTGRQHARVWFDLDEVGHTTPPDDGRHWLHHGDCVGADAQAHALARRCGFLIYRHPPDVQDKRAFCDFDFDVVPLPYLERNHSIVVSSEALIATPATSHEVLRSGTWATIRYAHKVHLPKILVVNPDGSTNTEWSTPL